MEKIREITFIPIAISINLVVGGIVAWLKLPLYLDSIGTVICGVLAGPWFGALTGIMSNLIGGLFISPAMPWYAGTAAIIGLYAGFISKIGGFKKWYLIGLNGIITGIIAAIISAPITTFVFGGISLAGTDALVIFFKATGKNLLQAVLLSGLSSDPIDKLFTYIFAWIIIKRMPKRYVQQFPGANNL